MADLILTRARSRPRTLHTASAPWAPTARWRVYAMAAKVMCHARRVSLKCLPEQANLVKTLLVALAPPLAGVA